MKIEKVVSYVVNGIKYDTLEDATTASVVTDFIGSVNWSKWPSLDQKTVAEMLTTNYKTLSQLIMVQAKVSM